jgi:hypothetical protein
MDPNIFPKDLDSNEYQLARVYPGHTSFVDQLEMNPDQSIIFSTGLSDEVIF